MALTRRRRLERLDTRTRSRRSAASGYTNEYLVRRLWCGAKQYETLYCNAGSRHRTSILRSLVHGGLPRGSACVNTWEGTSPAPPRPDHNYSEIAIPPRG